MYHEPCAMLLSNVGRRSPADRGTPACGSGRCGDAVPVVLGRVLP